ncbi:hypothetical protein V6N12_029054 [Hibiscus sabdariffa]|uniref:Uncharacterized protein n=1 Tax=Hibiscus sabdariffa TaxID=183260 RepID=A0ABR2F7M8_9ROSI
MFFFFVDGLEQQARRVLKSGAGSCKLFFLSDPKIDSSSVAVTEALRCRSCDKIVDPEFRFCPCSGSAI